MAMAGGLADQVISLVQDQVKAQGGILGHPLEIVKFDEEGQPAKASAGVTKLVLQDKVAALVWGGAGSASCVASSDKAEELKVPLFSFSASPADIGQLKYTDRAGYVAPTRVIPLVGDFVTQRLKPNTVCVSRSKPATVSEQTGRPFGVK